MKKRWRLDIEGAVQGVGFRPFVYRLGTELKLCGFVENNPRGVRIELEAEPTLLERFRARFASELPQAAFILDEEFSELPVAGDADFVIRDSPTTGERSAVILAERATCQECLDEIRDPGNRRFGYPFTNCTQCGPRYSIIEALPYDRPKTTMRSFVMCADCQREYDTPADRRFHAQPNACPVCGPKLTLADPDRQQLACGQEALSAAACALASGKILAVKGLGGFHLMVDAQNDLAIRRLRERKARPNKPLAVMVTSLEAARREVAVDARAAHHLQSAAAPILLLPRSPTSTLAPSVAPDVDTVGVMLAYTPLHHLLLAHLPGPVVATSANLSDEPICTTEAEAFERLSDIADLFLLHDRPIARHVDDSVAWLVADDMRLLRRARGYAPLPLKHALPLPCILALGSDLKNTVSLSVGKKIVVSQHIGDLQSFESQQAFLRTIDDLVTMYDAHPVAVAHDLHPDFVAGSWASLEAQLPSTLAARLRHARRIGVQHHHAHLASCLVDNQHTGRALGISWDGTGLGLDRTLWGGEFLLGDAVHVERVGHLQPFRLLGGDQAVREPRRVALALLWECYGPELFNRDLSPVVDAFNAQERTYFASLLAQQSAPITTSAGRLFDGVAALLGLKPRVSYEGEAAIALEAMATTNDGAELPMPVTTGAVGFVVDWRPWVRALVETRSQQPSRERWAACFHNSLVTSLAQVAEHVGEAHVALSGGCFQNRILTEGVAARLVKQGHRVLLHRQVPPNDGGLSVGQVMVAAATLGQRSVALMG